MIHQTTQTSIYSLIMSCKGPQHKSDSFRERIGNIGKTKSIKVDRNKCDCQSGAQPVFRIDNFNRIVVVCLELHEKRGDIDIWYVCPRLGFAVICWCIAIFKKVTFVILGICDPKTSNMGFETIWPFDVPWEFQNKVWYSYSNGTNRRNDLTGRKHEIYYSDRVTSL